MVVKYSTTPVTDSVKSAWSNIVYGNNTGNYGPTSSSGFWGGVTPPSSGYTIYTLTSGRPEPSIVVANNDTEAIYFAKAYGGTNIVTIQDAIGYLTTGSTNTTIVNMDYPSISLNGLVMNVDAGFFPSYPTKGGIWGNIMSSSYHGTKYGSPTFSTDGGGCMDFTSITGTSPSTSSMGYTLPTCPVPATGSFTIECWVKIASSPSQGGMFGNAAGSLGFRFGPGMSGVYMLIGFNATWKEGVVPNLGGNWNGSNWHHVILVYERTLYRGIYYLDSVYQGVLDWSAIAGRDLTIGTGVPGIARGTNCCVVWPGKLSSLRVYNRALTQTDITQNFNATRSRHGV